MAETETKMIDGETVDLKLPGGMSIDPARGHLHGKTGIFVRAESKPGKWVNADIAQLDAPSLLRWLRSRGGHNEFAENTVGMLLGHTTPIAESKY